jgi:hypothetical protein
VTSNFTYIDVSVLLNISGPVGAPPSVSGFSPGSGSTGTMVALTGANFSGASSLTVGGVPVSAFTPSASQITFTLPAGAVSGPISVVTPNGTATSRTPFAVAGGASSYQLSSTPITACEGLLYDSGGAGADYGNSEAITTVLTPATASSKLQLHFFSFALENGRDYLRIYDGASASAPLLGTYTGNASPGTITANNSTGKLTLVFSSDAAGTAAGFAASLGCATSPAFAVLTRTPASNSTNATLTTTVAAFFNTQPTASSANTIKLFSSQAGGQRALRGATVSGFTATVRPSGPGLKAGETVHVTVPATVLSGTGAAASPHVYQFTTATAASSGVFGFKTEHTTTSPVDVVLGDVTGDGVLDIVTANQTGNGLSVRPGSATGGFGFRTDYAPGLVCTALALGDVNNDGRIDVVATNPASNTVAVLLATDVGTLGAAMTYPTSAPALGVALGDVNGDGRLDLVASNSGTSTAPGSSVAVYLNGGQGRFGAPGEFAAGSRPRGVALEDLNNDGRLDLVATNEGSNTVSVLPGTGTGRFLPANEYAVGNEPTRTAVADVNGDTNLDLITSNPGSHTVSVLIGSRNGVLAAKVDYPAGLSPSDVATSDVNGDGRLDLVTANRSTNSAALLFNNGAGGFAAPVSYGTNIGASAIALADVDDDRRVDLATANATANTVSVLLNLLGATVSSFSPMSGPVGTTVTVSGANLTGASNLTLNGVPISGFVVNAAGTAITFTVPAGALSGPIVVVTPLGTVSSTGAFCVQYTPTGTFAGRCGPGSVTLTAAGVPTGGTYAWYTSASGGTPLSGATGPSYVTPNLTSTTTYYVAISTGLGSAACEGPRTPLEATINPVPPTPIVTQLGPGTLQSSAAAGNQWYLNGTAIAGATGQTYTVQAGQAGSYTMVVTSTANCASDASAPMSVVLSVQPNLGGRFRCYPSPATEVLHLERDLATSTVVVELLDVVGRRQWHGPWSGKQLRIPVHALPTGVYFVKLHLVAEAAVIYRVLIKP